ncbi:MAG TPA: hypothetical protein VN616_01720, partial [Puia sp.]|nr:hypothetical protein [Puia sp.]
MSTITRKEFLHWSGGAALAACVPRAGFTLAARALPQIAVQLYTIRQDFASDIPAALHKLASQGIRHVETAFWPKGVTVSQAAQYIRDAGLSVCSSHVEIPVGDHKAAVLETAAAFGTQRVIWHGWPEDKRYSSVEGTKELIGIYNEAGA